ncbi:ribulose-phosphate 3-epimerase [Lacticaseibacillus casei]|uniref:Ribulose-phosphate 3-epimerase n=1 Tax=Lacticaseibacillus huelsenbergensis TaxID=3035291 RepID=A0ABY8DSW5_9LACO|nr:MULTISPECIES: ribulose-phosphate 3-epimerase [Lacticaseibacillus]MDG3063088.1 ribulose-phosphate 3-epimerase [Lacticaseibacillus sp. BCRC 81376]QVI36644.1 ribulose-phosphate 3-epimerase [Lacticaseibacillus casei]QXG58436.1 ribulose-phosphate 3-epimerase [Lacticaseibacillus casei]WFB40096.1 ribulose-phosphate 3-epimerase [Lacticaseibacillus huelsenbergensis]WFB41829.1 ribulose-phosphate 3-epimerase [Lacticaseibacillus huelsenbergensis]
MSIEIAPSILSANFSNLMQDIDKVKDSGIHMLHVDVMDGHFVPNITFGSKMIADLHKSTSLKLDCHLMIDNPDKFAPEFARAGGDVIMVHLEASVHIYRVLQEIKNFGAKAGLVLNPGTPVDAAREVLPLVDQVLIMTVNPGFGGQKFIPQMVNKVQELAELRDNLGLKFNIEVDGGINDITIKDCAAAGANIFVAGSYVFDASDPISQVNKLLTAVGQ